MLSEKVDKIVAQVKTLSPDEQRELHETLEELLAQQEESEKMKAFHQALLASGLVKTIKTPHRIPTGKRELVSIAGKPISETIIEERR